MPLTTIVKLALLASGLLTCVAYARAQNTRHEISAGAGLLSRPYLKENGPVNCVGCGGDASSYSGTFSLGYTYHLRENLSIGALFLYESQSHDRTTGDLAALGRHLVYQNHYFGLLLTAQQYWLNRKFIRCYSELGTGIAYRSYKEQRNDFSLPREKGREQFAYQVSPFGIRAGRKLAGFATVGYGYKGIFAAGIDYRL